MFELILILLGLGYLDWLLDCLGIKIGGEVYSRKGRIQTKSREIGPVLIFRSLTQIEIVFLFTGTTLTLPRTIPKATQKITYYLNGKSHPNPYEMGPPLSLTSGTLRVSQRAVGKIGSHWKLVKEITKWPN